MHGDPDYRGVIAGVLALWSNPLDDFQGSDRTEEENLLGPVMPRKLTLSLVRRQAKMHL